MEANRRNKTSRVWKSLHLHLSTGQRRPRSSLHIWLQQHWTVPPLVQQPLATKSCPWLLQYPLTSTQRAGELLQPQSGDGPCLPSFGLTQTLPTVDLTKEMSSQIPSQPLSFESLSKVTHLSPTLLSRVKWTA